MVYKRLLADCFQASHEQAGTWVVLFGSGSATLSEWSPMEAEVSCCRIWIVF